MSAGAVMGALFVPSADQIPAFVRHLVAAAELGLQGWAA
jgi:hypothetical protein